jgi:hypothetical protein
MTQRHDIRWASLALSLALVISVGGDRAFSQSNEVKRKQGFSMQLMMNNRGVFGKQGYLLANPPQDSIGLEYPVGSRTEHIYGGGIWVGGLLDTSAIGQTAPPIRAVTTAYEGWSGPLYEMYPGNSLADSIWVSDRRQTTPPPGWVEYWGSSLPFRPISDQDFYMMYRDDNRTVSQHVPMHLKVIQSSYAWDDPYADAIIIVEYRIINDGFKPIDSAYVGFFFEADVGPISVPNYWQHNFTGYFRTSRTAYIHNPQDRGSTPVGATLLSTSRSLDSLRYSFRWYPGPQTPTPDSRRYEYLSSGIQQPDEFPALSDTRFLFGFGPFTIRPSRAVPPDPHPDTLKIAIGIISGKDLNVMQRNAARALDIYLNQGIKLPATPPSPPLRVNVGFRRVELDWKWRPGDDILYGRPDPEINWDTTNRVARRDPLRYVSRPGTPEHPEPYIVPPGIDSTKGGRNFEAYRLWRLEGRLFRDDNFTLIKQVDVAVPEGYPDSLSFEYNTGLEYRFIDSNLVRGKDYWYSVTSLSIPNLAEQEVRINDTTVIVVEVPVEPLESAKRTNAVPITPLPFAASSELGKVSVVPNPYRTDKNYREESGGYEGPTSGWDENARVIKFINLPPKCTIRIFSLAGDLVRTVNHDGTATGAFPRGDHDVTLLSESNRALASGVYIFTVDSDLGVQTGKFVIIR